MSNRKQAASQARDESDRGDMEQHAHKLIRGFEKLDEAAARRAIWELIQNACDRRRDEDCRITLDFRHHAFALTHNGKPFTTHTLLSLIKQVSGGKRRVPLQPEERGPVGQFGTGFITTHAFGRLFYIDSVLDVSAADAPPEYVPLNGFAIDRRAQDIDDLTDELLRQHKQVFELVETAASVPVSQFATTFRYVPASPTEREYIAVAYRNLGQYMPLVLALNAPLIEATVIAADGTATRYRKGEWHIDGGRWQLPVYRNDEMSLLQGLRSADGEIWVVLPLNEIGGAAEVAAELARLLVYFPLVGTEAWGCEFLIHSQRFAPLEPRDGLHLAVGNPQTHRHAVQNRRVLLEASELVFAFVEQQAPRIADPIRLARVNFGPWPPDEAAAQADFTSYLQQLWVEKFRELPLVETANGRERKTATACLFISSELLRSEAPISALHAVVAQLWPGQVPAEELTAVWTHLIREWRDNSTQWISAESLAQKLQEQERLELLDPVALRLVYDYVLVYGHDKLFDQYALLPTVTGEFKPRKDVKAPLNMVPQLVAVLHDIVPDIAHSFVHPAFADIGLALDTYGRSQLEKDINEHTRKLLQDEAGGLTDGVRRGLRLLASIYPTEDKQSTRRRLMPVVFRFYEAEYVEYLVPNMEADKLEYDRTPFRTLVRVFLTDVEKKYRTNTLWAATEALPLLQEALEILTTATTIGEPLRDLLATMPVFPNQNKGLRLPASLVIEKEFAPDGADANQLKNWYEKITNEKIQEKLVHPAFVDCLRHFQPSELTGRAVAASLEELLGRELTENITTHPQAEEIVDIILALGANSGWAAYFSYINTQKANIMLAKISDEQIKDDLFGIIGLPVSEIGQLGDLVRSGNLQAVIRKGQEAVRAEAEQTRDLSYKKRIGEGIEKLIRTRLATAVAGLPVLMVPQQGGQDLVVLLQDKVVYRIEVKARWRTSYLPTLSHLQATTASENPERYALCSVDLVEYRPRGDERERYEIDDVAKIEEHIRFVTDIGIQVETLIASVRIAEHQPDRQNRVQLADEFRVRVPTHVTGKGISVPEFATHLHDLLKKEAALSLSE